MEQSTITYLGDGALAGEITADSTPEYDVPFWPFDEAWDCHDWIIWHKKLKEKYGRQKANDMVYEAWNEQGFWEWNRSFCKYTTDFITYFEDQGIDVGNFVSKITTNVIDTGVNTSAGAKAVSAGLGNVSLNKILLVAGLAGGAYLLSPFLPIVKSKIKDWTKQ